MFNGHPKNQMFIQHFERLRQDSLKSNNLNLSRGITQIVQSLRKFPLPITSITQAELLQGVGSCYLSEFHKLLNAEGEVPDSNDWKPEYVTYVEQFCLEIGGLPALEEGSSDDSDKPRPKQARTTGYTPPLGGSAWACLIIMHVQGAELPGGVPVEQIYCFMEDFKVKYPKTTKFSDKVISQLSNRGLIERLENHNPSRVRFTPEGCVVSTNLWQKALRTENLSTLLSLDQFIPKKETFELIMVLDTREFSIVNALEVVKPHVRLEQRALPVADVIWVWRKEKSDEYMSGYAIERKTIEDLSMSIKDGRWEEQRRRLERAPGVSKVIYIIEGEYSEAASRAVGLLPEQSIRTAIMQTELVPGFSVVRTMNVSETADSLVTIHSKILSLACAPESGQDLEEMWTTYRQFSGEIHKTNALTIAQVTSKILRSVPGVGGEAVVGMNDYLVKSGMAGLTLANVSKILRDPNLLENMKTVTGAKRAPLTAPALAALREQYVSTNNS